MVQPARNESPSHQTPRSDVAEGDWSDSEPGVATRQHAKAKRGLPTEYDSTYTNHPSQHPKAYVDSYGPYATQAGGRTIPHDPATYNPSNYVGKPGPAPPQAAPFQPPPPPPHPNPPASTMNPPGVNQMYQTAYQDPNFRNLPRYRMNGIHPSQYARIIPPAGPPPNYFQPKPYPYPAVPQAQGPYPINGGAQYGNYPSVAPKGNFSFGGPPISRPKARRVKTEAAISRQQYDIEQVNQRLDDMFLDREQERARRFKRKKEAARKAEMTKNVERARKAMEKTLGTKIDELRRELQIRDLELRYEQGRRVYTPSEFSRLTQSVYDDLNSTLGREDEMANMVEGRKRYERQNRIGSRPASVISSQRDPRTALQRRATLEVMQDSEHLKSTIRDLEYRLSMMEQRDIFRQEADARQPNERASRRSSSSRRARSNSPFFTYWDGAADQAEEDSEGWDSQSPVDRRQKARSHNTEAYWAGTYPRVNRARSPYHTRQRDNNGDRPFKSAMRANRASKRRESSYETNRNIQAAKAAMYGHREHGLQQNPTYEDAFVDDDYGDESDRDLDSPGLFATGDTSYPPMYVA